MKLLNPSQILTIKQLHLKAFSFPSSRDSWNWIMSSFISIKLCIDKVLDRIGLSRDLFLIISWFNTAVKGANWKGKTKLQISFVNQ